MSLQIASRSRLPIESAVFAAACLPVAADAEAVNEQPSIKVNFGDLDLNMDAGRLDHLTRLKKGADRVCVEQALTLAGAPTTIPRAAAPPVAARCGPGPPRVAVRALRGQVATARAVKMCRGTHSRSEDVRSEQSAHFPIYANELAAIRI